MQNSMSGSENTVLDAVKGFFEHNWLLLLLGTLVFGGMIWLYLMDKKGKIQTKIEPMKFTKILKRVLIGLACFTLLFDVFLGVKIYDSLGIKEYNESLNKESDLYDKYYADARKTNIEFPEKKRNLIYIICESMESTYTDKKNGGGFQQNLIPELTALAQENTDFTSQEDSQLNGGYTPGNTTWTIAGIAAQSMGVPLNIGNNDYNRNFEEQSKFLPSVKGLGDILEEEGYQNYFMCGSDGAFAGRKNYYQQHGDYKVLDYYLNLIRQLHIRTYAYLGEMRASTNPLAYCEGGFLGGNLKLSDKIKPILKSATASFGITAFNELQELYNGKSLVEDGQFAMEVLEHINKKINEFKEEDGNLYAIYGTPAENLCGLQVKQFRAKYGIVEGVSDREYVSNSFHCHVTEDITPIEKQDLEYRFWELANGGKIQYVKYPIDYNLEAIKTLIRRAMDMGFYEGVNLSLAYCDDCGHQELEMDVCPKCGSRNLTKIDRMNGYLSYSRVHGDTRLNEAKMAEIAERKSM